MTTLKIVNGAVTCNKPADKPIRQTLNGIFWKLTKINEVMK